MCPSMVNGLAVMGKSWPRPKLACGVGAMVLIRRLGSRPWEVWFLCERGTKACFGRCRRGRAQSTMVHHIYITEMSNQNAQMLPACTCLNFGCNDRRNKIIPNEVQLQ